MARSPSRHGRCRDEGLSDPDVRVAVMRDRWSCLRDYNMALLLSRLWGLQVCATSLLWLEKGLTQRSWTTGANGRQRKRSIRGSTCAVKSATALTRTWQVPELTHILRRVTWFPCPTGKTLYTSGAKFGPEFMLYAALAAAAARINVRLPRL